MAYTLPAIDVEARLGRLRAKLPEKGVDGILVFGLENMRYFSGFTGDSGALLITSRDAILLTDFRYVEAARQEAPAFQVVQYQDLLETLPQIVSELAVGSLAYEGNVLTVRRFQRLQEVLPGIGWVEQDGLMETLRAIKEEAEVARMQEAARIGDEAFSYLLDRLRPGRTEKEVALELECYLKKHSEGPAFPSIVASGPRGALPHALPGGKEIRRGELVVLDFGAVVDGYRSDMTRTVAVGEADEKARAIYEIVRQAQLAALAAVRPGPTGREVDAVARELITQAGYGEQFGHGLGHGVGLAIHEDPPRLSPRSEGRLEENMAVTVEPGIYLPGYGGVRIEDLVFVTSNGARRLTLSPKELIVVG